jgi:hypothetical protein
MIRFCQVRPRKPLWAISSDKVSMSTAEGQDGFAGEDLATEFGVDFHHHAIAGRAHVVLGFHASTAATTCPFAYRITHFHVDVHQFDLTFERREDRRVLLDGGWRRGYRDGRGGGRWREWRRESRSPGWFPSEVRW